VLLGELSAEEIGLRVFVHLNLELLSVHADIDADTVFSFLVFFLRASRIIFRVFEVVVGDSQLRLRGNGSGSFRRSPSTSSVFTVTSAVGRFVFLSGNKKGRFMWLD